ncbi:MAG: HAD-IB family hydrolase [Burkholderiales bacterium]|nr:HAD-IB family hydrolase [Burkholderiales bacterium]
MHLVLFDMDHTLIPNDTGYLWAQFLQEKGLLSSEQVSLRKEILADYFAGTLDLSRAYGFEIDILNGLGHRTDDLLQEFVQTKVIPLITDKAITQVQQHKSNGDYLVMITATLNNLAKYISEFFGMDALIASRADINDDGSLSYKLINDACMGRGKLVHLEHWLTENSFNPTEYTFYSDSHNDIPLLEQVDNPIVVDPDDKLLEIAKSNSWKIISFMN